MNIFWVNKKVKTMKNKALYNIFLVLFVGVFAAACSNIDVQELNKIKKDESWLILPFHNYSQAPMAGKRAEAHFDTLIRKHGVADIEHYPSDNTTSQLLDLNIGVEIEEALRWANSLNVRYLVMGTVTEWGYKTGLDGEPAVGITLNIYDVKKERMAWTGSASKTGWGFSSLSGTGQEVMKRLVERIDLH